MDMSDTPINWKVAIGFCLILVLTGFIFVGPFFVLGEVGESGVDNLDRTVFIEETDEGQINSVRGDFEKSGFMKVEGTRFLYGDSSEDVSAMKYSVSWDSDTMEYKSSYSKPYDEFSDQEFESLGSSHYGSYNSEKILYSRLRIYTSNGDLKSSGDGWGRDVYSSENECIADDRFTLYEKSEPSMSGTIMSGWSLKSVDEVVRFDKKELDSGDIEYTPVEGWYTTRVDVTEVSAYGIFGAPDDSYIVSHIENASGSVVIDSDHNLVRSDLEIEGEVYRGVGDLPVMGGSSGSEFSAVVDVNTTEENVNVEQPSWADDAKSCFEERNESQT